MAVSVASISGASLTTAGGNLAITKPAGTVQGEVLICYIICSANTVITAPGDTVPWDADVVAAGIRSFSKIAGASEPASYTFTRASGLNNIMGVMVRITGAHATLWKQTFGSAPGGSGNTVTLPSLNVTDGFNLLQIAEIQANTSFTPPSAIELFDQTFATQNYTGAVGLETVGAGATGTRVWTAGASAVRAGVMYAIRAAAQTVSPAGFAPAVQFGTPTLQQEAHPSGFDVAVQFGTPTILLDQSVSPAGFDIAAAFGDPDLVLEVAPDGFDLSVTFGTPTLVQDQFVDPSGFDVLVEFGTPSIATAVSVSGFDVNVEFGNATVLLDDVLVVSGFEASVGFGTPTLALQPLVTGTVYNHETGDPVGAGVEVKLFDDNDLLIDTTVTAADGTFVFMRPIGDTDLYWTLATFDVLGVQYHGVSDRGCPAV